MTVASETYSIEYAGNGATLAFAIPYNFLSNSDIEVSRRDSTGDSTVLSTGFSITGAGTGSGTCTFTTAPASGYTIRIERKPQILQPMDLVSNDAFPAETIEAAHDRLAYIAQYLRALLDRCIQVPAGDGSIGNMVLDGVSTRASKYLGFNSNGDVELYSSIGATVLSRDAIGQLLNPRTAEEIAASKTPTDYGYGVRPWIDASRFGATFDQTTDDTTAINNAIAAANGRGTVFLAGVAKVSSQITVPTGVRIVGLGYSSTNGTGAGNRGKSGFLRAFTGTNPTVLVSGDDAGLDLIDIDNNNQGTGECVRVYGSRFVGGKFSVRNSGGDGLRLGKTNSGASDTNTNAWRCEYVIACGNAGAGMRLDDTNTTTSTSYPLGLANVNAGYCGLLDARSNGTDGLQIGNANDNVFGMVVSQSNTGCGIRFKTDGTNSGPRCNHILGNDCEANTGNDIQIDAATLPAAAPGLYNVVLGNRSVAVSSRIVDNSTGSLVTQWLAGLGYRSYHHGSDINALSTSGDAGFNAYVGPNNSPVRFYGVASGTLDGKARISVHKNGGSQTDAFEVNQNAVCQPLNEHVTVTYSASITIDASTGHLFDISANNGSAFTINAPTNPTTGQIIYITIRNTSGGALGAITWNAVFKMVALTAPANGFSRTLFFKYNGTNWVQMRTDADVPN